MNGKPNVEPAWMSLKRLVETRMIEILRKEQDNKRYIRLYGTEDYWHAFEESAFQLERLFRKGETTFAADGGGTLGCMRQIILRLGGQFVMSNMRMRN